MDEHSWLCRIIGSQPPIWAHPLRCVLRAAELPYAQVVAARNARFDRSGSTHKLSIPVISVGNITVGGTGKTPVVIDLARRLVDLGRKPAVISRGYKSVDGRSNDEERLIRRHLPDIAYVADGDRVKACTKAQEDLGADVIILDDGFQHRRLERSLDIVLVDATCPFGYGHLLPRGLLREPPESLRRADVIVLTRTDQVDASASQEIESRLLAIAKDATHLRCRHAVTSIETLDGAKVEEPLDGRRVVLFAGIGRPGAFSKTAKSLGVDIVSERWWPDHHDYTLADVESMVNDASLPAHDVLLTTEKDAVKLSAFADRFKTPVLVVNVAIDFEGDDSRMLQRVVERTLGCQEC